MKIDRIKVKLDIGNEKLDLGELVQDGKEIHFKYLPSFIETGRNISPIKIPFNTEIHTASPQLFDGLFGVFNDSLPDGWGKLLLDRRLTTLGINPFDISPLERLAYVGNNGMGALTYYPVIEQDNSLKHHLNLDALANETMQILKGSSTELIEELYQLGGSSGGARPKINVGYNPKTNELLYGETQLPTDYEHWLIKFPAQNDLPDIAQVEYAYALMAQECAIELADFKLFEGSSGKKYFGTKRFDRIGNSRIHMHSASGMMHDDYRYSQLDYGHIMDCTFKLEHHVKAYDKILRLAAFNVFSHNRDDHSKNFSFLMDENGNWRFAPAYDLTFSASSHGQHSTLIAGEGAQPTTKNLLELAQIFGMKNGEAIIQEVKSVMKQWPRFAEVARVTEASKKMINKTLKSISR
jgi:serine/threonine-protein kinase HipA